MRDENKVVRSKDVLDALSGVFESFKGQRIPISEVGAAVLRALSAVPEFYADVLTETTAPTQGNAAE